MLGEIKSEWKNYQFGITYSVTLNRDGLETSLAIRNTGSQDFEFKTLLHTYLAVDVSGHGRTKSSNAQNADKSEQSISQTSITGLESTPYTDKVQGGKIIKGETNPVTISSEVDRVYSSPLAQPIIVAEKNKPCYEITRDMMGDVVVWNPWTAKAKTMADFGPEGAYERMLCVEAGSVGEWNKLEAGDTWEGGQIIKLL